jgi:two-component system NarL family response regulator
MSASPKIRLLIADDHAVVRVGLASVLALENDIEIVGEAASGDEAVRLYRVHRPDIALLDVRMPGKDGIAALREICAEFPEACVVMLSTQELDHEVAQAASAGAQGYINKANDTAKLAAVLRGAVHGRPQFSPGALERLARQTDLAPREFEVLSGMARGLSNKEIAAELNLSTHTVKTYVKGVLSKLDSPDRARAVAVGFAKGILKI